MPFLSQTSVAPFARDLSWESALSLYFKVADYWAPGCLETLQPLNYMDYMSEVANIIAVISHAHNMASKFHSSHFHKASRSRKIRLLSKCIPRAECTSSPLLEINDDSYETSCPMSFSPRSLTFEMSSFL